MRIVNALNRDLPPHECGDCKLCCKILGITELKKPPGKWCTHATKGKGCSIYADRPESCQSYECVWRQSPSMPDALRPDKCHVIFSDMDSAQDDPAILKQLTNLVTRSTGRVITMHMDPNYPHADKTPAVQAVIAMLLDNGFRVAKIMGNKRTLMVVQEG